MKWQTGGEFYENVVQKQGGKWDEPTGLTEMTSTAALPGAASRFWKADVKGRFSAMTYGGGFGTSFNMTLRTKVKLSVKLFKSEGIVGEDLGLKKILPVFDGSPTEAKAKWDKLIAAAKAYKYAESETFGTNPVNFPFSVYGDATGHGTSIIHHGHAAGMITWPFNNSNTYAISLLDGVSIDTSKIDSAEFPGNRVPESVPTRFKYTFSGPWKK